jgi:hypothetical protein
LIDDRDPVASLMSVAPPAHADSLKKRQSIFSLPTMVPIQKVAI